MTRGKRQLNLPSSPRVSAATHSSVLTKTGSLSVPNPRLSPLNGRVGGSCRSLRATPTREDIVDSDLSVTKANLEDITFRLRNAPGPDLKPTIRYEEIMVRGDLEYSERRTRNDIQAPASHAVTAEEDLRPSYIHLRDTVPSYSHHADVSSTVSLESIMSAARVRDAVLFGANGANACVAAIATVEEVVQDVKMDRRREVVPATTRVAAHEIEEEELAQLLPHNTRKNGKKVLTLPFNPTITHVEEEDERVPLPTRPSRPSFTTSRKTAEVEEVEEEIPAAVKASIARMRLEQGGGRSADTEVTEEQEVTVDTSKGRERVGMRTAKGKGADWNGSGREEVAMDTSKGRERVGMRTTKGRGPEWNGRDEESSVITSRKEVSRVKNVDRITADVREEDNEDNVSTGNRKVARRSSLPSKRVTWEEKEEEERVPSITRPASKVQRLTQPTTNAGAKDYSSYDNQISHVIRNTRSVKSTPAIAPRMEWTAREEEEVRQVKEHRESKVYRLSGNTNRQEVDVSDHYSTHATPPIQHKIQPMKPLPITPSVPSVMVDEDDPIAVMQARNKLSHYSKQATPSYEGKEVEGLEKGEVARKGKRVGGIETRNKNVDVDFSQHDTSSQQQQSLPSTRKPILRLSSATATTPSLKEEVYHAQNVKLQSSRLQPSNIFSALSTIPSSIPSSLPPPVTIPPTTSRISRLTLLRQQQGGSNAVVTEEGRVTTPTIFKSGGRVALSLDGGEMHHQLYEDKTSNTPVSTPTRRGISSSLCAEGEEIEETRNQRVILNSIRH